jgi:CheY-like chemotaxis protein
MPETQEHSRNSHSELIINGYRKKIELISITALFCLIAAVLLLSFNFALAAGILIIAAASLGILVVRKITYLLNYLTTLLGDISRSNEKQSGFISDFSHRIREPLNNLVIVGDILLESGLPKKQHELVETFVASNNNMVTAVNELTMNSAAGLNFETRKQIRFNVFSSLQNTIDLYNLKDKSTIDFILLKDEINNYEFIGDPIILKQIFLDVFNTIEIQNSNERKKVTITLSKGKTTGITSYVEIELKTAKKIDFTSEKLVSDNLAAKLIASAKGSFRQETKQDGTILNISLPLVIVLPEVKHQIASARIEELSHKTNIRKEMKDIKILLVEDNIINQKITLLTLKPLVKSIDTASNGKEALDKFGTTSFDLILMDIQMPIMNGLTAVEKIRSLEATTNAHIPILAITANAMLGDREKCIFAGADDYISKPFQPSALIEKIKTFFQQDGS